MGAEYEGVPHELPGQDHFDRLYAEKEPGWRAAWTEALAGAADPDALEWKDPEPPTSPPPGARR